MELIAAVIENERCSFKILKNAKKRMWPEKAAVVAPICRVGVDGRC